MLKAVLVVLFAVAAVHAVISEDQLNLQWAAFKVTHNKVYESNSYEQMRFAIFRMNMEKAEALNADPKQTATFGATKFSDLTAEEFAKTYLNYMPSPRPEPITVVESARAPAGEFDWREKGAITDVKDQGQCGSCWAFSAVEEMESTWFLAGNKLTELSTQQVTSCDLGTGDHGCQGGDTVIAFEYMAKYGMMNEASYPYTSGDSGSTGACRYKAGQVVAKMTNYTYATPPCFDSCSNQDEDKLKDSLANVAPVSICVTANVWQSYSGGILSSNCAYGYRDLNHCTQLVGLGVDSKGQDYWKIRNSWGTGWGIDGYIHIAKGKNLCGVADEATITTHREH